MRSIRPAAQPCASFMRGLLCLLGLWFIVFFEAPKAAWALPASTTSLALSSGGNTVSTVASGSVVTLTATVTSGGTAVTPGQVNFCDATAAHCTDIHLLGTAQLTSAGTATLKLRPGIGSHSYQAVFLGTTSVAGSSSSDEALTVTGLFPTTTTIGQSGSAGSYTLTATVAGIGGPAAPTGSISFENSSSGQTVLAQASLSAGQPSLNFVNPQSPATGTQPLALAVSDFNGDGIPDIAAVNEMGTATNGTVSILLGNGDGTFTAVASRPSAGAGSNAIAVGDFNGDGNQDLAITNGSDGTVTIFLGAGNGTFSPSTGSPITVSNSEPDSIAVADVNGDGKADLVVGNLDNFSVNVFLGNGDGTFSQASGSPITVGAYGDSLEAVAVADVNGDGIPDIVAVLTVENGSSGFQEGTAVILLGNGDGTFTPAPAAIGTGGTNPTSVLIGDFNGDGKPDLAIANECQGTNSPTCSNNSTGSVTVFLGDGQGGFTQSADIAMPATSDPAGLAIADFNGDGNADIAVTNASYSGTTTILLGNGDGTFTQAPNSPVATGDWPTGVAVADFNGDGTPDFATADEFGNNLTVILAEPTQTATASATGISPIGTGTNLVDAVYPGDSNYGPSTSATIPLTGVTVTPTVTVIPATSTSSTQAPLNVTVTVTGGTGAPTATGSVILSGGSYTSSATTLSGGSATITIPSGSLSAGADSLTASYTPDAAGSVYYTSAQGTGTVTVAPSNFVLSNSGNITVSPGSTSGNTSTISITPTGDFTGTVSLTCAVTTTMTGVTAAPTCNLSQASPSITGTSAVTSTLTISTTAPTSAQSRRQVSFFAATGGTALALLCFFIVPARRKRWGALLGLLILMTVVASGGCGSGSGSSGGSGNSGSSGTTAGAYTVTVTGTAGSVTKTTSLSLIVNL